jgi:uncharacterized protein RhaS with RHS repeats
VYLRARDYDPATGQFLSVDPEVDSTLQPYAYAGNDPVSLSDPSGLDFWSDLVHNVGAGLGAAARASNCFAEQAVAFGAGALDSLTFGASSLVLGAAVPGYDDFVAGHLAAFTAGSIAVMVVQAAVAIIGTAGAGVGAAVGLVALKVAAKAAVKDGAEDLERTAAGAVERGAAQTAEEGAGGALQKYEVGTFNALKSRSVVGDDLDVHHDPQTQPARQVVDGYDRSTAPSIALPTSEHRLIPNETGTYSGTAGDLLGQDVANLRNFTMAPDSAIGQLIDLVHTTYPGQF